MHSKGNPIDRKQTEIVNGKRDEQENNDRVRLYTR